MSVQFSKCRAKTWNILPNGWHTQPRPQPSPSLLAMPTILHSPTQKYYSLTDFRSKTKNVISDKLAQSTGNEKYCCTTHFYLYFDVYLYFNGPRLQLTSDWPRFEHISCFRRKMWPPGRQLDMVLVKYSTLRTTCKSFKCGTVDGDSNRIRWRELKLIRKLYSTGYLEQNIFVDYATIMCDNCFNCLLYCLYMIIAPTLIVSLKWVPISCLLFSEKERQTENPFFIIRPGTRCILGTCCLRLLIHPRLTPFLQGYILKLLCYSPVGYVPRVVAMLSGCAIESFPHLQVQLTHVRAHVVRRMQCVYFLLIAWHFLWRY